MMRHTLTMFIATAVLTAWNWPGSVARADEPQAVATFHSIGLYWSPNSGGPDKQVLVRYRETDTDVWFAGLPMRYLPIAGTDLDLADYRGSLVHLRPGATYEIELSLDDNSETKTITAATWPNLFPEARTVQVSSGNDQLDITESGTADGYVVYDGNAATIDVQDQHDYCISVDASYVIIRGLTLLGAHRDGIRILGGHNIIIEDSDISGWGRLDFDGDFGQNMDAAVYSSSGDVAKVVVQRCLIHNPRYDSNSWAEYNCNSQSTCTNHPAGPQAIVFFNNAGNHVFRYNKVWSDADHYYNDIFGGGSNGSYEGYPGPDSDIYGNDLANCWDDGIEAEGGGRNVRIWANHDTETYLAYANAAVSIGPWYLWRNVSGRCYSLPNSQHGTYGPFLKMGYAGSVDWMTGNMYIFHNTIWNVDDQGCSGLGGSSRYIKHCVTRNNVLHVRSEASRSIAIRSDNEDNDFDYDLYSAEVPDNSEAHGVQATPTYVAGAGYDPNSSSGNFQLEQGTAGHDSGALIPNFDEYYLGADPDMGAQETGADPMVFGPQAGRPPVIETASLPEAVADDEYSFTLQASGGRQPLRWTLIAGSLPDGLGLSPDGVISGTPQAAGTYSFSVYVRNADSLLARADMGLTVNEAGHCPSPLERCGDTCVDLTNDHDHCGSCDHACGDGEVCQGSACVPESEGDAGTGDSGTSDGGHSTGTKGGCGCSTLAKKTEKPTPFLLFLIVLLFSGAKRATKTRRKRGT